MSEIVLMKGRNNIGNKIVKMNHIVICFAFVILLLPGLLLGQTPSLDDTLEVISIQGNPGDTVSVLINMVNTFGVGGISLRMGYDFLGFEAISMDTISRSGNFGWTDSNLNVPGVIRFIALPFDPANDFIPPGEGFIAIMRFYIRDYCLPGYYPIQFEDEDSTTYDNSLSDSLGIELVIPVFNNGYIHVLEQTEITNSDDLVPREFNLHQNYPNPFNQETLIRFTVSGTNEIKLEIFDVMGRIVDTPFSGRVDGKEMSIKWNGVSTNGEVLSTGVYFYKLSSSSGQSITKKMVLLR